MRWLLLFLLPSLLLCGTERTVLGLYNSDDFFFSREHTNLVALAAEMPLNHLGVRVQLHDIARGIPPQEKMEGTIGILCLCHRPMMRNPLPFCQWLTEQIRSGQRLVLMGEIPFMIDIETKQRTSVSTLNALFSLLGLQYADSWTDDSRQIVIEEKSSEMMDFERVIEAQEIGQYIGMSNISGANQVYLTLERRDIPGQESAAVVTGPQGGYAQEGCALYIEPTTRQKRWFVDPFLFFSRAFGLEALPRFDTTTLWGRRIFFSHIDGDGVRNATLLKGYRMCGDVIFEEILKRYELPVTVSFITCEVNPRLLGNRHMVRLARDVFELENIEPAVHGFSHPLDWKRKITVFALPGYSVEIDVETLLGETLLSESAYSQGALITVPMDRYLRAETVEAADYLNKEVADPKKPVVINLWTGDCLPPGKAIELVNRASLRNMNGGDSRFDRAYPTYTAVAPLVRHVGDLRQVYTTNANETIYTDGWTGHYYAQIYVIETYQQTERPTLIRAAPRRVSPMNLYYHFYAGERRESLDSLKSIYDYVIESEPIALWASEYCDVVDGFYTGEIELADDGWRFSNYGRCSTVRFDDEERIPDLDRSKGVLGFSRWENSLYIHLTPEGESSLYLSDEQQEAPYLVESSVPFTKISLGEKIAFETRALGPARVRFANMGASKRYTVSINGSDREIESSEEGELVVTFPAGLHIEVEVEAA